MEVEVVSTLFVDGEKYDVGDFVFIETKNDEVSGKIEAIFHNKIVIMNDGNIDWYDFENIFKIE